MVGGGTATERGKRAAGRTTRCVKSDDRVLNDETVAVRSSPGRRYSPPPAQRVTPRPELESHGAENAPSRQCVVAARGESGRVKV